MVNPTPEQKKILYQLSEWLRYSHDPFITLGGYAGTGKTTLTALLRLIIRKLSPTTKVAFCAYTGKAARVLELALTSQANRFEGDTVSTIHSLIYAPRVNKSGHITSWRKKSELSCDLIIIDEASMVDQTLFTDLLSYQKPIIAIGDHGQLPPINSPFNLMATPQLTLTTIHRQAAESPIIALSILARETGQIPIKVFGPGVVKLNRYDPESGEVVDSLLDRWHPDLLILTGFNHTRQKLNDTLRALRELDGSTPKVGDQVICLRNNRAKGIYNGMTGILQKIIPVPNDKGQIDWFNADILLTDTGAIYSGRISAHQFGQPTTLKEYQHLTYKTLGDLFDYGYALTVHKAQGSQSPRVLLFEERNRHMDEETWRRWLYTGVTRAQSQLTLVGV